MKNLNLKIRKLLLNNYFYYIILMIALTVSFLNLSIPKNSIYDLNETSFEGKLIGYTIEGNKFSFIIYGDEKIKCNYYFDSEEELEKYKSELKLGSKVFVTGELREPINNTIPNTFNYKKYLYYHNIFYLCNVKEVKFDNANISFLYKIKNYVIERIMSFEEISDYLMTFIIGDKSLLDSEVMNNYRQNGITHLFAISGMHIGLFSTCLLGILKKLKFSDNKRYILTIIFIWFYAFLTGFAPSVLRAGLLFSLLTLNKIFYTEIKSINILILTGSILVFINPFIIMDIGFIYSFLTTFGLMYASKTLEKHKIIGTSLVAMMFSLPVTINNFYEFNILSIFINIIFVPFVSTLVYPICLVTFIFKFLEPITNILLNGMEWLNGVCSSVNLFHIYVPKISVLVLIIYYLILLVLVNKKFKLCIFILFMIIFTNRFKPYLDSNYYITFLDVGQGDSILIQSDRNKEVILLDTGGAISYDTPEWKKRKEYHVSDNVINYLRSIGIKRIDYMILSHGDADHLGEALNIINNINVENVILNRGKINYTESKIIDSGVNILKDYNGILDLKILWTDVASDENSNSLIVYLKLLDEDIMLMGDAPQNKEEEILSKYDIRNIDLIKLGHHGSRTSSKEEFLKEIGAKNAIISSGRDNKFGHPHLEVIETLNKLEINYFNTQDLGSIQYIINKKGVTQKCYPP